MEVIKMDEKREKYRIPIKNKLAITIMSDPTDPSLSNKTIHSSCLTQNISSEGLAFSTHTPICIGSKLIVSIAFPDPVGLISHIARVKWVKEREESSNENSLSYIEYVVGVKVDKTLSRKQQTWQDLVNGGGSPPAVTM